MCTQKNTKQAPEQGKHCARGGTRTGFQPLQTLDSRQNTRNPAQSGTGTGTGTGTAQSVTQSADTVHTPNPPHQDLPKLPHPN